MWNTLHALFEKQFFLHPKSVVVKLQDQEITYQELNDKRNQLADCLIH